MHACMIDDRYPDVPDYVDFAFITARAAAPEGVKLFYNDYDVAANASWTLGKADRM